MASASEVIRFSPSLRNSAGKSLKKPTIFLGSASRSDLSASIFSFTPALSLRKVKTTRSLNSSHLGRFLPVRSLTRLVTASQIAPVSPSKASTTPSLMPWMCVSKDEDIAVAASHAPAQSPCTRFVIVATRPLIRSATPPTILVTTVSRPPKISPAWLIAPASSSHTNFSSTAHNTPMAAAIGFSASPRLANSCTSGPNLGFSASNCAPSVPTASFTRSKVGAKKSISGCNAS